MLFFTKNMKKTIDNLFKRNHPIVIAEIGKNFIQTKEDQSQEKYLENAKELIKTAKDSGADAVKFQTHVFEDEQLDIEVKSPHFNGSDRYSWVKRNTEATPLSFWKEIKKYSDEIGIMFFSTPMSRDAAKLLDKVGVQLWKVGSGDILDFVMLDYIALTGKPIIISSGMSKEEELDKSIDFLKKRTDNIILMHCVSKYPCPPEELYLDTILYFSNRYNVPVGFSDHSLGIEAVVSSIGKGARIIEKHFTLDRGYWGSDHNVSMLPNEFKRMVDSIRNNDSVDASEFGEGVKVIDKIESAFRPIFRKSLTAGQDIPKNTVIKKEMLYAMRPQKHIKGLPSEEYENVLGKKTTKDLKKYDPIIYDSIN